MDPSTLSQLVQTPIGRRWVLKLGGASALAGALAARSGLPATAAPKPGAPQRVRSWKRRRTVYAALPNSRGFRDLQLRVAAQDYPIRRITERERRHLRRRGGLFQLIDANKITHIAENVPFVTNAPSLMILLGRRRSDGRQGVLAQRMSVPPAAATKVARAKIGLSGSVVKAYRHAPWVRHLGIRNVRDLRRLSPGDFASLDILMDDSSTAATLVNMHPEIVNLDDDSAAITTDVLLDVGEVGALGEAIAAMREEAELPYWMADVIDPATGQQTLMFDDQGNPVLDPDTGEQVACQTLIVSPELGNPYGNAVRAGITAVKAESTLEGSTYYVQPSDAPTATAVDTLQGTQLSVQLSRSGWNWGTQVTVTDFDQSLRRISLRFYNNWERLLNAHIQYFSDSHTQLAVDNHDQDLNSDDQSWRTTANSEYLTYVSDMPTSYGVPWNLNANYTSAVVTLPDDATFARVLLCGAGSGDRSQWQQFMTNDTYSGKNFPDECKWPLILSWVFDVGIPCIMLGFDAAIAGGDAISSYKSAVKYASTATSMLCKSADDGFAAFDDLGAFLANSALGPKKSTSEEVGNMALAVATFLWGGDPNFKMFADAGALITAMIVEYLVVKAIPVMGEVFGALAAAGDIAAIATSTAEMSLAPWVIDCDVRLTYAATVTLLHDPKNSSWPRAVGGARWTLQVVTDGTDQAQSITGTIPDSDPDPLEITLPAVPVSKTIQYTFTLVDVNQNLIGQGQSAVLANNDFNSLPTSLTIQTQELFKPITAQTIFVRQDTLRATSTSGLYHWQPAVTVPDVSPGKDLYSLDAVSVGTVSGMVGSIWQSADTNKSYWVRNTPSIEHVDANNVPQGVKEQFVGPYTRRPFLIYDRLNPSLTAGNNFFLEPQTGGGYLVRRLALSEGGGALSWPAGQSWGQFLQDMTAVTYHPYGYLIGINATTGKVQSLKVPNNAVADGDSPPLASLYSGSGSRAGLTMTPTDLTCTLDGVILVLEAGANRMQAFDVNGNPVNYFGSDPDPANWTSTQQLNGSVNDARLGIAVDGQSYVYVLTRTGSGNTGPSSFRVDVHRPDGTFVVAPTGVNVAAFDVDYWRTIFGLDFAVLTGTDGVTPYVDPAINHNQPSLSIFVATTPAQ